MALGTPIATRPGCDSVALSHLAAHDRLLSERRRSADPYMKGLDVNDTWIRDVLAVVLAHAAVNLPHAAAHIAQAIWLPPAANAFVVLVILLAPFVALGLLYARRQRAGALLLLVSMLGA